MSSLPALDTSAGDATEILRAVEDLFEQGLSLQAYQAAQPLGPLPGWSTAPGRVMAGRLANVLGNPRLGILLHVLARREQPGDELAAYYGARAQLYRRGPWAAWQTLKQTPPATDVKLRASLAAYRGYLLALLRDFPRARSCFAEAIRLAPVMPWIYVEQASSLILEDQFDAAREAAQTSLRFRAWYRPGVQMLAHLHRCQSQPDKAIALLREAGERLECGEIELDLARLLLDEGAVAECAERLERAGRLLPLPDKSTLQRLDALRAEVAYRQGDEALALELADRIQYPFFEHLAKNIRAAGQDHRRVELAVPFVPQHHLTCGPATLTSLARFWSRPAEHLQVAEAICYDGTSAQSERRWAEQSGFLAREFTVDWPTTVALIDRGVPFTLTTVEATNAHLQGVIGYDARRGTLFIRDPSSSLVGEMLAAQAFELLRGIGPRGMLLVPAAEAARVEGIDLVDADLYDQLYKIQRALDAHNRVEALGVQQEMVHTAPGHRLTWQARRAIAAYDADPNAALQAIEQLLQAAPNCAPLLFAKVGLLKATASRAERLAVLEDIGGRKDLDPIFRVHWVEELTEDAREHPTARRLLKKLLRQCPLNARCYYAQGDILWSARDFDEATELYRFAACLDDRDERPSRTYFIASRHVGRTTEALDWLRGRWEALGGKSGLPAQTLFWAYEALNLTEQGFALLDAALRRRPDDDSLPLFAADAHARYGRYDIAAKILEDCRQRVHEVAWLRVAATLDEYRGEPAQALEQWRQAAAREPQSVDAAAALARLLTQLEGNDAATEFWRELLERFPFNLSLVRAAAPQLGQTDPALAEQTLERFLEANPLEPWARRQRALHRAAQQRWSEALADADLAVTVAPADTYGYSVRGSVLSQKQRLAEAAIDFRRAIELFADNESAIHLWLANCRSALERRSALEFFYGQLVKQITFGDGLLAYAELARPILDGNTLLTNLRAGLRARPDLWQAWSAVIRQLLTLGQLDEARVLARQMADRFPLMPMAWAEVAAVRQMRGKAEGEIAALTKALEINGNWTVAIFRLIEAYTRQNRLVEARKVVEQALHRLPDVAPLHAYRADLCWRLKDRAAAVATLTRALELDPDYPWAWERLLYWGAEIGQPELAAQTGRTLTQRRPGESRCWHWLAAVLVAPGALEERLAAARRAIELDRHYVASQVLYSRLLAEAGRFDEALALCRSSNPAVKVPHELRAQEAAILRERGEVTQAISTLRTVLADNPDYVNGWQRLADWCASEGEFIAVQLEAAQQIVRLRPHESDSWCQLGRAAERSDRQEARRAWTRALELAPDNAEAANALFDLQFADNEFDAAGQTLLAIEARYPNHYVWLRRVQWAASRAVSDPEAACGALERLCLVDTADPTPLREAITVLDARRAWRSLLTERMAQFLATSPQSRHVLSEWAALKLRRGDVRGAFRELDAHREPTQSWNLAAVRLLENCEVYSPRALRRFVRRNAKPLAADPLAWGTAGFALWSRGFPRQAVGWLADYRHRDGVQPWMLVNLVQALWRLGKTDAARQASEFAMTLSADHTTAQHHLWLAIHCALAGEVAAAEHHLAARRPQDETTFDAILRIIARNTINERQAMQVHPGWLGLWGIERRFRLALYPHGRDVHSHSLLRRVYVVSLQSLLRAAGYRTAPYWLPWMFHT